MEDRAEDDADVSKKKPKRKSKQHRDRPSSDVEEEDGDSARVSFTEEDDAEKKNTKKKKTKKRKTKRNRHGEGDCAHSAVVGEGAAEDEVEERTMSEEEEGEKEEKKKMKKKTKGKKKDKKRKRGDDDDDGDDGEGKDDGSTSHPDDDDHSSSGDKKRSSMKEERKEKKRSKKDERRIRRREEMDERTVASSAIEHYPDDHKRQYSKSKDSSTLGDATVRDDGLGGKRGGTPSSSPSGHGGEGDRAEEGAAAEGVEATTTSSTTIANGGGVTLLLFYQYVEPPWDDSQFRNAYEYATNEATGRCITGRMRIAREGMNCTLTGSPGDVRGWCGAMRSFDGGRSKTVDAASGTARRTEFADTEFKLTDDLPPRQRFPKLHAFEVVELVHYGLAGSRAPDLSAYGGTHLEPEEYHVKMCESDTVIIDVRNHYEANIGRFDPPVGGATMIDPMMRKSTEFPLWLDKKETKEMLRGKQVLMYCTGGVRCERASALLKQKIDEDEDTKDLGIKGVYQLQGGIDKYFKQFPAGGLWRGKNYTFDKRFAHAPPAVEAIKRNKRALGDEGPLDASSIAADEKKSDDGIPANATDEIMGKCEACSKPWDMYRGKRRCPTCGVPSLICRECFEADKAGTKRLGKQVRCDLCVADGVRSKFEFRDREEREMKNYEGKLQRKLDDEYDANAQKPKPNPERITRLFLKNMCAKQMDERKLLEVLAPARVTYIQWLTDRNTGKFYGSAFIEVKTAEDASSALALDGMVVLGRKITVKYQKADEKDIWPIPRTEVKLMSY